MSAAAFIFFSTFLRSGSTCEIFSFIFCVPPPSDSNPSIALMPISGPESPTQGQPQIPSLRPK